MVYSVKAMRIMFVSVKRNKLEGVWHVRRLLMTELLFSKDENTPEDNCY